MVVYLGAGGLYGRYERQAHQGQGRYVGTTWTFEAAGFRRVVVTDGSTWLKADLEATRPSAGQPSPVRPVPR